MESKRKNLYKPIVKVALLSAALLFILSLMGVITLQWPWSSVLGQSQKGWWLFGDTSAFEDFVLSGRSLLVIGLVVMGYLTYRAVRAGKRVLPLYIIAFWGLMLGLLLGAGPVAYSKYSKKQEEEAQKARVIQEKIDKAVMICEDFPGEEICTATSKERNEEWAGKVDQCFTLANARPVFGLPEECSELPDVSKELTSVTPSPALEAQVLEGEQIAKLLTPQVLVTAGELWGVDHFPRFAGIGDLGDCLFKDPDDPSTPAKCKEDEETTKRRFKAEFDAMLRGEQETELRTMIEKMTGAVVGLSLNPESLTEEQKRGIGITIGFYNHLLRIYNEHFREEKARVDKECAKYAQGTLRPARCVPEKTGVIDG